MLTNNGVGDLATDLAAAGVNPMDAAAYSGVASGAPIGTQIGNFISKNILWIGLGLGGLLLLGGKRR